MGMGMGMVMVEIGASVSSKCALCALAMLRMHAALGTGEGACFGAQSRFLSGFYWNVSVFGILIASCEQC